MTDAGAVAEIFSSFQGEGPYAGLKQIFVRLSGCHLRCAYCDTPAAREGAILHRWSVEDLIARIVALGPHPSVSFTGGEPVLQAEFVREAARRVRALGMKTYLDTSGTLADRLAVCAPEIDVFAFDIKIPSSSGAPLDWDDARRCLALAGDHEAFVKIVVTRDTREDEMAHAAEIVPPAMPLILQPVTGAAPPDGALLARLRAACRRETWVIPQLHVLAGWR